MSESSAQGNKGGMAGWLKAAIASIVSAASGAVLMYASPLLDAIIKPAKPLANFESHVEGLKMTVQNKSTGGHDGWWDFGDGSALEPFVPEQLTLTHNYNKPGPYLVKLSLKNLVGEENDRAVTVVLDDAVSSQPSIESFRLVPIQGDYAPATYKIEYEVKNASLCVWALGNRPLDFSSQPASGKQVRLVSFREAGQHVVRLAAFNGKQHVEKTEQVVVKQAPAGTMTATVDVSYDAVLMEQRTTTPYAQFRFPMDQKGDVIAVTQTVAADVGFEIINADFGPAAKNASIKSTKLQVDPVKRDKALVTCELARPSARTPAPVCNVQLVLTQQRQGTLTSKAVDPVSVPLVVPGATVLPMPVLPAPWIAKNRKMTLTLQQDAQVFAWKDANMPHNTVIQTSMRGQFLVNVVEQNGQLRIELQPMKAGGVFGN